MEKNSQIEQGKAVPLEIRKEVYAEALELIQSEDWKKIMNYEPCLCIFLPCVLWGINTLKESLIRQTGLSFNNTSFMFPELEPYLEEGEYKGFHNKARVEFLKSVK